MKAITLGLLFSLTAGGVWAQSDSAPTNAVSVNPPAVTNSTAATEPVYIPANPGDPVSRGEKWEHRAGANSLKAQAKAASIELIFDGDSITDYWQSRGKAIWAERYAKYNAFDFAIAGDTTHNLLWRLAHSQAQGLHPKLIFLLIGTNNLGHHGTPQEAAASVKEVLAQYQKVCPDAVIALQAIFPRGKEGEPIRAEVKETNELISKFADGTKVIYLDFGDKFLTPTGVLEREIMPDLLHPSEKGYQIWADAIQPTVDKYFPAK